MTIKLISGALILFAAFMSIKHGWQGLTMKPNATGPEADLFGKLNLSHATLKVISILTLLSGILILIPQTFVAGNLLNAALIFFLMIMFFYVGEFKAALIEIPFLLIPLVLIYLKYPLG
ncbi:hypothetical protein [Mucilaginibacter ginsenosidivorax]|uniref:DoxX family protein n=1 Tax=Mucilaginibacter ginsenosidivorax TaxID=862126 RepID=A0A5B8VUK2_9SPHI|nr:hypothetical protein [Mucilaginibacter ginsenosidivorax]QEC75129.1 hypothetical protein FSB76_03905 [Mucilaginibacter ginsenosidivorax]